MFLIPEFRSHYGSVSISTAAAGASCTAHQANHNIKITHSEAVVKGTSAVFGVLKLLEVQFNQSLNILAMNGILLCDNYAVMGPLSAIMD